MHTLQPDNDIELFKQDHQMWLRHPITKAFLARLDKHETKLSDVLANSAMNKDIDDATVRRYATQLQTTKTIKNLAYDTETNASVCS